MRRFAAGALILLAACRGEAPAARPSPLPRAPAETGLSVLLITIDTLRADHMGVYGYHRATSPHMDALAREGTVFDQAYTYWPKTRGSFVMMMTGRRPSQNGYGKSHPRVLDFNPTIADTLRRAGYATAAVVDNPNVAASLGYAKGFESYRETWEETALATEMDRTRAITQGGRGFLSQARSDRPFFLWLHYVNPHAPYTPPPPYNTTFLDAAAAAGPRLKTVNSFHGGIPRRWVVAKKHRLGYYVAQYDGEVAAVDAEVGRVLEALASSGHQGSTLVIVTSDHGESLGEHDYYFDHGEDLFDPCLRVPLIARMPGAPPGRRSDVLASTLDLFPTILDAVKVSYPPDLAGQSVLAAVLGQAGPRRERLFAGNEHWLQATFGRRLKLIQSPAEPAPRYALYDRGSDPGETHDVARARPDEARVERRELELQLERADREWSRTRALVGDKPPEERMTKEACEKLKALGYVQHCAP